ncbi:MAG: nucleotidyltransferase family protein [Planctomycetaceae bacterium]
MSESGNRLVVIVPAAGHSRRMGCPKLLLPLGDRPVIARLVEAFAGSSVLGVLVVVRADDDELAGVAESSGAIVVRPAEPPADMKASVALGLEEMRRRWPGDDVDGWMLVPGDHPVLDSVLIERVITAWSSTRPPVLVPTSGGRRGHPTVFARRVADELSSIPSGAGLNHLVAGYGDQVEEVELGRSEVLLDLDTPEQYAELCRRFAVGSDPSSAGFLPE